MNLIVSVLLIKLTKTVNELFGNAVIDLGKKEYEGDIDTDINCTFRDQIDIDIMEYKNHPSSSHQK